MNHTTVDGDAVTPAIWAPVVDDVRAREGTGANRTRTRESTAKRRGDRA